MSLVVEAFRGRAATVNARKAAKLTATALRDILPKAIVAIREDARERARDNLGRQYDLAASELRRPIVQPVLLATRRADEAAARVTANEIADAWLKAALKAIERAEEAKRLADAQPV